MRTMPIGLVLIFFIQICGARVVQCAGNDLPPADALMNEQSRLLITKLDDPDFCEREAATEGLYLLGKSAVDPLAMVAENGSTESSTRAFEVLQRLYLTNHEPTFQAVDHCYEQLKLSSNLSAASRAIQSIENASEIRQERAIALIDRLGGIVIYDEKPEQQNRGRPWIEHIALGRSWVGGKDGLRLLGRIHEVRSGEATVHFIRGVTVANDAIQDLQAELTLMVVQYRGPARLGVRQQRDRFRNDDAIGCMIDVEPGSSAELAGLRTGDIIIEIDEKPVRNFQSLIQIIYPREPGDRVPIVFFRGSESQETQTVTAELTGWEKQQRKGETSKKTDRQK